MNRSGRKEGSALDRGPREQTNSYNLSRTVILVLFVSLGLLGLSRIVPAGDLPGQWQTDLAPSAASRQEVSYVEAGGKFYLAGGGTLHERYDPATDSWSKVAPLPVPADTKLDHVQGVEVGGKIYYIGGLLKWPDVHDSAVRIYDPKTDTFSRGAPMPEGRGRGGGGVAVHNGKIYYAGGLHDGNAVAWFDVYDPAADSWTRLPDMPRARDHFHAAVVEGKFYAIGGRAGAIDSATTANHAYDLAAGEWQTGLAPLPTARGGFAAAVLGKEILIIGGEGNGQAYNTVEAYNTAANSWRKLTPMPTARHGIQAAVCNGGAYVAAGGTKQGGGGATRVHEAFFLGAPNVCGPSQDTEAPNTTIEAGPSGTVETNDASFAFSSSETKSTFACKLNGGSYAPCTSPKDYWNLPEGPHTFEVRATDTVGNIDPSPASRSWTVDTSPVPGDTADPTISRLKPSGKTRDRTPRISAVVRDAGSELTKADIKLYVDGKARTFSYSPSTNRLSGVSKRLSYGKHAVKVVATDEAGNRAAEAWRFKVVRR